VDRDAWLFGSRDGRLSRRQLLERSVAAGAALSLPALLAACGGDDEAAPEAATTQAATTTAAAAPKPGGTAVIALSVFNPQSTLDPARATSDFDLTAGGMLYDNLVTLDTSFSPSAGLAEEWEVSDDATVWTFKLRQGVEFHDGAPLTANDAAWTIQRVLAANLEASGVRIVDPATLELTLLKPNAFFAVILGGYSLRVVKDGSTNVADDPVGTGPFVFEEFIPGELFVVTKNPNYWQEGTPYLDGIRVLSIPEQAAKVQAVLSGEPDLADVIDIPTAKQLESDDRAQLLTLKNASFNVIAVQASVAPYDKPQVRQALKHALDRERIVNVVLQGQGLPGADIPIGSDDALYPEGFEPLAYDPEKAKSLLAEVGFADGLPVKLFASDAAAFMAQTAAAFQDIVKDGGIDVQIEQLSPDAYWSEGWMQKPCFSSFWLRQHPDTIIAQACEANGVWNEAQFKNPQFDSLVAEARSTTDADRQRELYAEAMPLLAQDSGWIIPQWGDRIWPAKKRFAGLKLDFIDNVDFTNAYLSE